MYSIWKESLYWGEWWYFSSFVFLHLFISISTINSFIVIVQNPKRERGWRTFKRPGVEAFLEHLSQFFEIVIYSDQLNMVRIDYFASHFICSLDFIFNTMHLFLKYVDPVIERLDQKGYIRYKLSRAATKYVNGKHYRVCKFYSFFLLSMKV